MKLPSWQLLALIIVMFMIGMMAGSTAQEHRDKEKYIHCLENREFGIINVAGIPRDVTVTIDGCRITAKSLEE